MECVTTDRGDRDFVLTIVHVLTLAGRGTSVVGPVESGNLRSGEQVEVWDGDQLLTTARASLEMVCSREAAPGSIGLALSGVDKKLLAPGQTVRRRAPRQ